MITVGHAKSFPVAIWDQIQAVATPEILEAANELDVKFIVESDDDGFLVAYSAGKCLENYYLCFGIWCLGSPPSDNFMHEGMAALKMVVAPLTAEEDSEEYERLGFVMQHRLYCSSGHIPLEVPEGIQGMDAIPLIDWKKYELSLAMQLEAFNPTESGRGYEKSCMQLFERIKADPELAYVKIDDGQIQGLLLMQKSEWPPGQNIHPSLNTELYMPVSLVALSPESSGTIASELLHYAAVRLESQNRRISLQVTEESESFLRDTLKFQYIYTAYQYVKE